MQCPNCHKTGFVVISNRRYCSNCGTKLADQGSPRAMSDLKPTPGNITQPATALTEPSVTPSAPLPSAAAPITSSAAPVLKPANQFHGTPAGNTAVLDLRSQPEPAPAPTAPTPEASASAPTVTVAPPVAPKLNPVPPAPVTPLPTPAETPAATTVMPPQPAAVPGPRVVNPVIRKTTMISKPDPITVSPAPAAAVAPIVTTPTSPMVSRFPAPAEAQSPSLPPAVATQVEAMKNLIPNPAPQAAPADASSTELRQVLATAKNSKQPSIAKVGAAIAAIMLMGGMVWMQNSPKMAFRAAAGQAGIDASLPTYIPSSYQQSGPAQVSSGQLTLAFKSPGSDSPLAITQKRTDWDSNSLRENYVSRQSDKFLAVQGQGLTIFVDNNQANWVNHGIWYSISGTAKLSREQILKIAYGL